MAVKQRSKSLVSRKSELSDTFIQLNILEGHRIADGFFSAFAEKVKQLGHPSLKPSALEIFQINVGKLCNQSCAHCHVDAGPDRKRENMDWETMELCLNAIKSMPSIHSVDITGGAPELNPHFRRLVLECRKLGKKVMDRCNLTIIMSNDKFRTLPAFFAENEVHIIASLPHFNKNRTDSQRGDGVFEDSIEAIRLLNQEGYGKPGSSLKLDLVYNPSGAFLPSGQATLEPEFRRQLKRRFDVEFSNLFCITNMPISRFLDYLLETGNYESYMEKLVDAFNPATLEGLMCRNTLSVSWDGYLYDCDFNQMLDLKVETKQSQHIRDIDFEILKNRDIVLNQHCYGCTAGAGSSCGGEIA